MKSSYNLMMEGKQNILFLDLLDIIKMIFDEERDILNWCAKNKKKNINVGGSLEKRKNILWIDGANLCFTDKSIE